MTTMAPIRGTRSLVAVLAFVLGVAVVPHRVCERDAKAWYDGDPEPSADLAATVARFTDGEVPKMHTGNSHFDSEFTFSTYMMGAIGFGQLALDGRDREANIEHMEKAIEGAMKERGFDTGPYEGESAFATDQGHIALLGYLGFALALHRQLVPNGRFAKEEQQFIGAIERRYARPALAETYPGQIFAVDNSPAIAALAVHARALNTAPSPALVRAVSGFRTAIDPKTGLLLQSNHDGARGSGTALAAYFMAYADRTTSADLLRSMRTELFRTVLGFGGLFEHPSGSSRADIDSGPVILGFGVSATGFALGASRANQDEEMFRSLWASTHLFGAPRRGHGFLTGGPLGDAVLFAMITAQKVPA